ncbi:hypothetical protein V1290_005299 [Bradyrhizobium sp. AZCC 1578]|uniref:hypothetical protein n=1 Tax=Bradyrhizobium sp. AZCC 1578 TaxID=3117027 RepID=UPI002FEEDD1B
MTRLGPDVPLHFTAFHPDYKMLDLPRTPALTLTMARDIARKAGLQFVYTGNVHDERGQSTYCPGCSERIIGRDWYDITTVWSGRALQEVSSTWQMRSCINVSGLCLERVVLRAIMDISAHAS